MHGDGNSLGSGNDSEGKEGSVCICVVFCDCPLVGKLRKSTVHGVGRGAMVGARSRERGKDLRQCS